MQRILGLDVAGLIIDVPTRVTPQEWAGIRRRFLSVPPVVPFEHMRRVTERFDRVCLISAASDIDVAVCTRAWLDNRNFWGACRVARHDLYFCEPGKKSEVVSAFPWRLEMMVDDDPDNISQLVPWVTRGVFYDRGEGERAPPGAEVARSWAELHKIS